MHGDTRPVSDPFAHAALADYLRWHLANEQLPGLRLDEPMQLSEFTGGPARRTYLIRWGGAELVLRRPHPRPLPSLAQDVAREYHWLAALHPFYPLAPRPLHLCEDRSVLDGPFSIMERRRGLVARDEEPMPLAGHPGLRAQASASMVDALVALHALDITEPPTAALGRPIGFLDRQVRGWTERWAQTRRGTQPAMDTLALWLTAHQPPDTLEPAVVHGEFRLDNVLLNPLDPSQLTAVLDWETADLGDPLVDLGLMLAYWTLSDTPEPDECSPLLTGRPGYFRRDEIVARYAAQSGQDLSTLPYCEVLALFTIAVRLQLTRAADHSAQPEDVQPATLGDKVEALATRALALTSAI